MEVIYIAAPAALLLGAGFVAAFIWAVRRGELDDLSTPPVRMLFDDDGGEAGERGARGG
ncbi:MAG: cbb3-type cytochrome oxidase assembly protein CcoS [Phycisphaerales bacterium]|nr:cbb3-type cytochrome oxidase assembly protein CcoS [Phycisphaerales bacterium]